MPTQPLWNLGPTPVDFYSMLAGIGKTISHGNETEIERQQRERQLGIQQQHVDLQKRELDQKRDDARTMGEALIAASGQFAQPGAGPVPGVSRSLPTFGAMQGAEPSANIKGVIQSAAAANGVSPEYLTRMVGVESNFDPNARNPSGAAGLAQFVPGTWKQYGGNASPLNPEANAMAAGAFTRDNQNALRQRLGRDPTQGELYLAHQQGAGGAAGLLSNPDRPAADVVGLQAVASNLPRGAGDPRTITAGQFASLWTRRFADLDASRAATPGQPAPGVPAPARPAPVVVAESEDEMRAAEAGMMPGSADRPAPGAAQAAFTPPPAPDASRVAVGASAGGPAAATSSPAAPAPAAVLSQGLRGAAQAGMAPRDLALVRAMAMNPALQGHAAQILAKYATPQDRTPLQRFTGRDGNEYAFDPASGSVAPVAQFGDRGARAMTADERATYSVPEGTGAYFDEKGQPHTLQGTAQTKIETNVSGNKSETKYDEKVGGEYAETFVGMQKAGRNAAAVRNSLNLMDQLVQNPNFYSGAGQEYVNSAKKALAAIGVNAEGNKPNEVFDALSKRLTLDVLGGNLGAGVSNTDVSFITSTSPSLTATPEGNRALIDMHRKVQDRQAQVAQMAREYVQDPAHPRLDPGFDAQLAQFARENPIFPDPYQQQVSALKGPEKGEPLKIQGDDEYNRLPSGAVFVGPDGKKRRKP